MNFNFFVREYFITTPASRDRKSTRLNSSHLGISYAVFCLKKNMRSQVQARSWRYSTKLPSLTGTATWLGERGSRMSASQKHASAGYDVSADIKCFLARCYY